MHYNVYILKTSIYQASIWAETEEEAAQKLKDAPDGQELRLVDSWWDLDTIEVEE